MGSLLATVREVARYRMNTDRIGLAVVSLSRVYMSQAASGNIAIVCED